MDTQLLPDSMTLPLLWLGLGVNLFSVWTCLSAAWRHAGLWVVVERLLDVQAGDRQRGQGLRRLQLLGALGAWFGWQAVPLMILLSSFVGATLGLLS